LGQLFPIFEDKDGVMMPVVAFSPLAILQRWIAAADLAGEVAARAVSSLPPRELEPLLSSGRDPATALADLPRESLFRLQNDAVRLEQMVGTRLSVKMAILGQISDGGEAAAQILRREFPNRRGIALLLEKPDDSHIERLRDGRHLLLWPAAPTQQEEKRPSRPKVCRKTVPSKRPRALPAAEDLDRLSGLTLPGLATTGFASRPFLPIQEDIVRLGALTLLGRTAPEGLLSPVDILLMGGVLHREALPSLRPALAFASDPETPLPLISRGPGQTEIINLRSTTEIYGLMEFNPEEPEIELSVRRSQTGTPLLHLSAPTGKRERIEVRLRERLKGAVKDRLTDEISSSIAAGLAVNEVLPYVVGYLSWLESTPEATRGGKEGMLQKIQKAIHRQLPRRSTVRAFELFLSAWGMVPS